jgi:hypothetical protein
MCTALIRAVPLTPPCRQDKVAFVQAAGRHDPGEDIVEQIGGIVAEALSASRRGSCIVRIVGPIWCASDRQRRYRRRRHINIEVEVVVVVVLAGRDAVPGRNQVVAITGFCTDSEPRTERQHCTAHRELLWPSWPSLEQRWCCQQLSQAREDAFWAEAVSAQGRHMRALSALP